MSLRDGTKKMSKSSPLEGSRINLNDSADDIRLKIRKAKTDSIPTIDLEGDRPEITNLVELYAALSGMTPEEVVSEWRERSMVEFKDALTSAVVDRVAPIGIEMERWRKEKGYVDQVLVDGAKAAREIAAQTMIQVREGMQFV